MNKRNIIFVLFSLLFLLQQVNASETIYSQYNYNLLEIKDVSYKIDNVWHKAKTIDSPESYIIDYKNKTKTIQVHLSGFNKDQPIFAIITTPEKLYDIDTELNTILDEINNFNLNNPASNIKESAKTHSFKKYTNQSNYIINNSFKIDYWDSINFNLGAQNQFNFNIEKGTENNLFVLIFMQFSDDSQLINLAYVNLYVLDNKELSTFNLCEINRNIVDFYCKGEKCNIPKSCLDRWDFDAIKFWRGPVIKEDPETTQKEQMTETLSYSFNGKCSILKQNTIDEYINCLRYNIDTVDLVNKRYEFINVKAPIVTGNEIINQKYNSTYYSANSNCYTNESYNKPIFEAAKNAKLTEEETSQLWARLSAESGCNPNVSCGDKCTSYGIGQINDSWNNLAGYNSIKKYLIEINSSKYDSFEKYQKIFNKMKSANRSYQDNVSSVEISIAINKHHKKLILNSSSGATKPFLDVFDKEYDHDDAIDIMFATAYVYGRGSSSASHFSDGVKIGKERWQGVVYPALRKIGYYLVYKRMIYNCHNNGTTNAFVNAYKTVYGGKYCDKPTMYHSTINSQIGLKILNQAEKYLGRKYKWEGRNGYTVKGIGKLKSDFDCVGLKYVVLRDLGYLDDSASCLQMFSSGCAFADYLENNKGHIKGIVGNIKNKSDLDNLKPGDFLSLNTKSAGIFGHAAIYVGVESGKHKYIHASGSKKIAGSVKYDYLEDKLSKGTLKYPFQYQRITGVDINNIDCSKNYISVSKDFSGCCKYTKYC